MKSQNSYFYGVEFPKSPKRIALTPCQIMLVFLWGSVCGGAILMMFV